MAVAPFGEIKIPLFDVTLEEFLQKHYKEMSEEEKRELIERLEKKYEEEYGVHANVKTTGPNEGQLFAYALNAQKCIGCRRCVYACVQENNQSRYREDPRAPQIQWIRVLSMEVDVSPPEEREEFGTYAAEISAGLDIEGSRHYYDPETVPEEDTYYFPVQCQQCENPPCVQVCPVRATWKEPDGRVVIDYNWCIGCKYCISACPYWARRFNWSEPYVPADEINTDMHYLGNRIRPHEVVEKCTFCIQRTREGRYPACVEACPVGARKFGDILDPESEIRKILRNKRVFRLKDHLGTDPKFFYFMEAGQ